MTVQPSPYDLLRQAQDQIAVLTASLRALDRSVGILAGMLDTSAPDPVLNWPPAPPKSAPPAALPARRLRRVEGPTGRPPESIDIDGITIETTQRRAGVIRLFQEGSATLAFLVARGMAPNANAMMRQIVDINADLERAGSPLRIEAGPRPPRAGANGSVAPTYSLVDTSTKTTTPETFPSAQSEAEASARLEQGSDDGAAGDGESVSAQSDQFVTRAGEEEGCPDPVDASPAADEGADEEHAQPAQPEAPAAASHDEASVSSLPSTGVQTGHAGSIAVVDPDRCSIIGPGGSIYVNTRAARILDVLRNGDLFDLAVLAKKAKVPNASDCHQALRIEVDALKSIGLDLYLNKLIARLRRPE